MAYLYSNEIVSNLISGCLCEWDTGTPNITEHLAVLMIHPWIFGNPIFRQTPIQSAEESRLNQLELGRNENIQRYRQEYDMEISTYRVHIRITIYRGDDNNDILGCPIRQTHPTVFGLAT